MCRRKRGCCPELDPMPNGTFRFYDHEVSARSALLPTCVVYALHVLALSGLSPWHAMTGSVDPKLGNAVVLQFNFGFEREAIQRMDKQKVFDLFRWGMVIENGRIVVLTEYDVPEAN